MNIIGIACSNNLTDTSKKENEMIENVIKYVVDLLLQWSIQKTTGDSKQTGIKLILALDPFFVWVYVNIKTNVLFTIKWLFNYSRIDSASFWKWIQFHD